MIKIIEQPTSEPVSVDELKQQCRIETNDENTLLKRYIVAARQYAESIINYYIPRQKVRFYLDKFENQIFLDVCPVISIDSVNYFDTDNTETLVNSSEYTHFVGPTSCTMQAITAWPSNVSTTQYKPIFVDLTVGKAQPLEQHKQAILLIAAHWYKHREDTNDVKAIEIPHGANSLLFINNNQSF